MNYNLYKDYYNIDKESYQLVNKRSKELQNRFEKLDDIREYNQIKVIKAFKDNRLSHSDFSYTTGYGYGDVGRDKVEKIYADIFHTEDALVRPTISSGTHALALSLFANLYPGDAMLSITDHPYDTLQEVIGISGDAKGTLKERGVEYNYIPLIDNKINLDAIKDKIQENTKLILIQRSTGYGLKRALTVKEIGEAIAYIKEINKNIIVMVDNCYGEFTEKIEPSQVGADLVVGSLIKNPGGGIAIAGGYIVGSREIIERVSNQLYSPGLGKETGLTFDTTRLTLQGLFFAPHVTIEALKSALLFANVFGNLGYKLYPTLEDPRSDIIQAIVFGDEEKVITFVQSIQEAASVGSHVTPYPWEMPGYTDKVIMASGGFVDGSSIEISADGPLREPYLAYYQGGIVYDQAKLACMISIKNFREKKLL